LNIDSNFDFDIMVKAARDISPTVGKRHSALRQQQVKHTLKFGSLFAPAAFKDLCLFFRNTSKYNSFLKNKSDKRILVKQSYILLMWLNYIATISGMTSKSSIKKKKTCPSFFVYPFRNYKTTIIKAPMAHKTHSQEQFMIRFYKFSITFYTNTPTSYSGPKEVLPKVQQYQQR
jgi:hypothetical protein